MWFHRKAVWYVYPRHHLVSFSLVAQYYIKYLRKFFRVSEVDELSVANLDVYSHATAVIHPYFFIVMRHGEKLIEKFSRFNSVIGVDVADTDHITQMAVSALNYADAVVVPSSFSKKAYKRSGVQIPIHVVPHGVPEEFTRPKTVAFTYETLRKLYRLKQNQKMVFILYFLWHSEYRKGADLVYRFMDKLTRERRNIVCILKCQTEDGQVQRLFRRFKTVVIGGWIPENYKIQLYDLCDIYALFSRGGGFEINGLEAVARGEIVLAPDQGAWTDYLPKWMLVKSHYTTRVFGAYGPPNMIHDGGGYEIDVEKAVDKAIEIIDNIDEYKEKAWEYAVLKIHREFTWEKVSEKFAKIIEQYP